MPVGKIVRYGVWEHGKFVGAVVYGRGSGPNIAKPFGLDQSQVCELVRVALRKHSAPVSKIVAVTLRLLKRDNPGIRVVVSFADPAAGHHGGIYQAMGWSYIGAPAAVPWVKIHGKVIHSRTCAMDYGSYNLRKLRAQHDPTAEFVPVPPKFKYVKALDDEMSRFVAERELPYPSTRDASAARLL
jgi:hypothetical protein